VDKLKEVLMGKGEPFSQ